KTGRLKLLAVGSMEPSPLFPGVPAVAASLPGFEAVSVQGILAPAKTPDVIVNRLSQETVRVLRGAEAKERVLSMGSEAVGSSADEFANKIKSELATLAKLIKEAGIRTQP